jgi:thermitase
MVQSQTQAEVIQLVADVDLGPGRTAVMAFSYLEALVAKEAGDQWRIEPYRSDRLLFSIQPSGVGAMAPFRSRRQFAELSSKIAKDEKIKAVHIDDGTLSIETFDEAPADIESGRYIGLTTEDPLWALKFMDVFEAWEAIETERNRRPGEGVIIGHVDTGLLPHPEIWGDSSPNKNILWSLSKNFRERGRTDALDLFTMSHLFQNLFPAVPSHGTATASVMISPHQLGDAGITGANGVTGVAPSANLLPVRSVVSAVYTDVLGGPVARGIDYVVEQGAKVVGLAMGGAPNPLVHKAIRDATKRGAIVFAAGGNHAEDVPRPGLYKETIAIGAGNIACAPWSGATSGDAIDALAPGQDVWHATSYQRSSGELVYSVRRGVGSSFSTPLAAGVAALWLSYHGWDHLAALYGPDKISDVFRWVLQNGGLRPCDGLASGFGGGYFNALRILRAPLPDRQLILR